MNDMNDIPDGALVLLTSGEYSDYSTMALARAVKPIPVRALLAQYLAEHREQAKNYSFRQYEFLAWVEKHGYIETLDYTEWYVGSYACSYGMTTSHSKAEF